MEKSKAKQELIDEIEKCKIIIPDGSYKDCHMVDVGIPEIAAEHYASLLAKLRERIEEMKIAEASRDYTEAYNDGLRDVLAIIKELEKE